MGTFLLVERIGQFLGAEQDDRADGTTLRVRVLTKKITRNFL
jgi:hypothetical protein